MKKLLASKGKKKFIDKFVANTDKLYQYVDGELIEVIPCNLEDALSERDSLQPVLEWAAVSEENSDQIYTLGKGYTSYADVIREELTLYIAQYTNVEADPDTSEGKITASTIEDAISSYTEEEFIKAYCSCH